MMEHIIGIGDYTIASGEDDRILTHALGSCVAVTFYCSKSNTGAMIHIALPHHAENQLVPKPGYYADLGLQLLIDQLRSKCNIDFSNVSVNVFGGADSKRQVDTFLIGPRNLEAVKKILAENNLKFNATETGGNISRTIELNLKTGNVNIKKQPLII